MLAEWQQLQAEVWELDSKARHLEPSAQSSAEQLARQRQYHAELRHALRQLRSAGSGTTSSSGSGSNSSSSSTTLPRQFDWTAKSLEDVCGHHAAQAWAVFFRALGSCPRVIPALAHAAGYQTYEAFAHIVRALVDDALLFSMQGGAGLVHALNEVLEFEFDLLVKPDVAPQVATLLADGSFLAVLMQLLTLHAPACMAWAEEAFGTQVMEAIGQAIAASSGGTKLPSGESGDSNAVSRRHSYTEAVPEVASDEGIQTFIGEDVAPGAFPGAGQSQQKRQSRCSSGEQASDVALCHAASVVVSSLCEHAMRAPMELCRLAAALCRQLSKRCSSEVASAAQDALLGSLLLTRWLVPSLLTPGQLGHSLGFGLVHTEPHTAGVLVKLAKLLKAIVSETSQSTAEPCPDLGDASTEFIRHEAERLKTGLFRNLRARGEGALTEASQGIVWPRCMVCTTTDFSVILQAAANQPTVIDAAISQGVPADVMKGIVRSTTNLRLQEVVVVWLQHGDVPILPRFVTEEAGPEDRGSTGGTDIAESVQVHAGEGQGKITDSESAPLIQAAKQLQSLDERDCLVAGDVELTVQLQRAAEVPEEAEVQGDAGGTASIVNAGSGGTGASGNNVHAGSEDDQLRSGLEQLWHVLAEPHPLEGPPEATLLSAVHARQTRRFGSTLTQLLRLEMLAEWLRSNLASRPGCMSGTIGGREQGLLGDFRRALANRRASVSRMQRLFYQVQVAQRLVEQHIVEASHALRQCARVASELRCNDYLQSLWITTASNPRKMSKAWTPEEENRERCGPDGPLEFCMLSPPKNRGSGRTPRGQRKGWVANLFGGSSSSSTVSSSSSTSMVAGELGRWPSNLSNAAAIATAANGEVPIQASVQLFEVFRCPYHRIAAVSTTMGLEQLSLEQSVKHRTPRNLRQAILAFQQLPLESIVQGDDPLSIAAAIHALIDMLAARLITHCKQQEPPPALKNASAGFGSANSINSQGSGMTSQGFGMEEHPRPADIVCVDDRQISEYVGHFVFGHLHLRLFPHEPTDADLRMAECISRLAWLKPRHLDVPDVAFELAQVSEAIKLLRRLCRLRTPGEMLASLASASRNVSEAACLRAQLHANRGSNSQGGRDAFGADELVPLFILVVLRANPPMFNSVLLYIERLTSRQQMLTEQGYTLTQLRAAVSFTESVRAADLVGLDPGEWERHMSSAREPARR